ncbi:CLUMA_CG012491, isoform A [Clunio marinus]|uniref:Coiled-coil domain-containing protein 25 n=1 Tax=Clunio marinus TaxID=568069 RepID=A0A1J1IG57_9DIPT|nr:CLUMA_CG012491, isoform A [Clunio marinus]
MVFYFTSNVVSPPVKLFMGLDKYENEELIKWGFPEDVWFHVDNISSAHVYLRLQKGQTLDDVHHDVLIDACQLVKANSINGNKMNNIDIVYTMWENLKKTPSMDVGQVSFHNPKQVRKMRIEKRINEIVNRLNKTKVETHPDFRAEREARDAGERQDKKKIVREQKDREKEAEKKRLEDAELKSYASLHKTENMTTTNYDDNNDSDDFM